MVALTGAPRVPGAPEGPAGPDSPYKRTEEHHQQHTSLHTVCAKHCALSLSKHFS